MVSKQNWGVLNLMFVGVKSKKSIPHMRNAALQEVGVVVRKSHHPLAAGVRVVIIPRVAAISMVVNFEVFVLFSLFVFMSFYLFGGTS